MHHCKMGKPGSSAPKRIVGVRGGAKRKRHTKVKTSVAERNAQKAAEADKEADLLAPVLKACRREAKRQKERKRNAPEPIRERKDRGYGGISAGCRVDVAAENARREKRRLEKAAGAKKDGKKKKTARRGPTDLSAVKEVESMDSEAFRSAIGGDFFKE